MWIFAGGMFRSGSTLQFQIVSTLIERAGLGRRLDWRMPEEFAALAEEIGEPRDMLVFKTHVCKHPMRVRLRDGRARAVAVHRDLRDVIVSGANKDGIEPTPAYCEESARGWLACFDGWPVCDAVRWWSYDRFMAETPVVVLEMADHLGVPGTREQAAGLAEEFAPERQIARIERAVQEGRMKAAVPGGTRLHAEVDLLHPNHIRDGRTGQWREVLSDECVGVVERLAGDWLVKNGYMLSGVASGKAAG